MLAAQQRAIVRDRIRHSTEGAVDRLKAGLQPTRLSADSQPVEHSKGRAFAWNPVVYRHLLPSLGRGVVQAQAVAALRLLAVDSLGDEDFVTEPVMEFSDACDRGDQPAVAEGACSK